MQIKKININKKTLLSVCVLFIIVVGTLFIVLNRSTCKSDANISNFSDKTIGKIAIIVDDWGYNSRGCEFFKKLQTPISISILPKLQFSSQTAKCAHKNNKEVMLHLPLEPHKFLEKYPDRYVILTSMDKEEIINLLKESFDSVPFSKGTNNHMGSKATEDVSFMRIIFDYLNSHNLFFVDSIVSGNSICEDLAKETHTPFVRRNIFLDNKANRSYIEGQFKQLANLAKKNGYAVGIGHDRPLTQQIILEQTKLLEEKGFKFVTISELINSFKN